ncbi:MAG: hypothetical protein FJZ01_17700 [Candidatus Sericytochromatia bacterium]|nr:hypothetical protein [Candidatus Tanganyikabacteria bacterium]
MKALAVRARLGLALSLAAALAGCGVPGFLAGSGLGLSGRAAVETGTTLVSDGLSALDVDDELDRGAIAAQDATYRTMALAASGSVEASGSAQASSSAAVQLWGGIGRRMERLRNLAKGQLEAFRKLVEIKPAVVTTHADGSVTTTNEIVITRRHSSSRETVTRTEAADGTLLFVSYDLERENKTGHKLAVHRDRRLAADGSWTGSFRSVLTRKDGKTKTVAWTIVGAADGSERAEGTITRFDGSVATITITRSVDGTATVVLRDDSARVGAEAAKAEAAVDATVKIRSDADGKVVETAKIEDTTEIQASDR